MTSVKQNRSSENQEKFGIEDCEALLEFPYHDYAADVKREINLETDIPFPDLGLFGNLVLNNTNGSNSSNLHRDIKTEPIECNDEGLHEESLALNQALQRKIQSTLTKLQDALQRNIDKQDELIELSRENDKNGIEGKPRLTKPISLFASPYFRDVRGMVPPENEDTMAKFRRNDVTAYLMPPKPWTRIEKNRLIEGVAANALNIVLKPYKTKRDYVKSKLKDKNLLEFELDILKKQILTIEKKIKIQSQVPLTELLEVTKGKLDWMTISATNLQGTKSEDECENMWNNYLSHSVNKKPFTVAEDKQMKKLVQKYKGKDWDSIAKELYTNRTAIQCLERYQTHLNEDLTKRYWTPEEDEHLIKIVEDLKVGNYIPWNKVCCYMEGRARHQIINRYERTVCKEIKRGSFTVEEDAMLIACVKKFGLRWTKMKEFLPGRPTYTIRERYVNTLDTTLKIGDWTKTEDVKLIELIKKYGYGKWAKISREMCGRTDNMCLVRARRLELHSRRRAVKKTADEYGHMGLRPAAPSKSCISQNSRLKLVQNCALDTLRGALEKIQSQIADIDMETMDLSSVSVNNLRELHRELSVVSNAGSPEEWVPHYVPPHFQKKSNFSRKKVLDDIDGYASSEKEDVQNEITGDDEEEDDEESVELDMADDDKILSRNEKLWLYETLQSRLREEAYLVPSGMKSRAISLNSKETAECVFYRAYLRKKMFCSKTPDEDWNFNIEPEYEYSIADVIRYFIEPELEENQPIVLCPNFATLSALEVTEATKQRLRRTASFIDQSKPYLQYLVGYTSATPKCTKCRVKRESPTQKVLDAVLKSMQNRLLMVDEDMKKASEIELGVYSETCKCKEIAKTKEQFNLLQKRFLSTFLWPSLLSSTDLKKEQEAGIDKNVANKYTITRNQQKSFPGLKRKRKPIKCKTLQNETRNESTQAHLASLCIKEEPSESVEKEALKKPKAKKISRSTPKVPLDTSNLRRSRRSCVLRRKSFAEQEVDGDQSED